MSKRNDHSFERLFPSPAARKVADDAIDAMGLDEPMRAYLDAWVAAYKVAGGKTPVGKS